MALERKISQVGGSGDNVEVVSPQAEAEKQLMQISLQAVKRLMGMSTYTLEIHVKMLKTVGFDVNCTDTVDQIKSKFNAIEGIDKSEQELFTAGIHLKNENSPADYNIMTNSFVDFYITDGMQISVKIPSVGRTIKLNVKKSNSAVDVKAVIERKGRALMNKQILLYTGRQLEDPLILIHDKKDLNLPAVVKGLELALKKQKPLLIVAENVGSDASGTLNINKLRAGIQVCAVKAPGTGENRKANLQDLAIFTGGEVLTEKLGMNLENFEPQMLGPCKRVTVSKDDIVILDGAGDKESIEERAEQIRPAIEQSTSDIDKKKLQERLAKLYGGVVVLKIGVASESSTDAPELLYLESVALRNSIVPGFQFATNAGPLCDEPMWGLAFIVEPYIIADNSDVANQSDQYNIFSGQVITAVKEACRAPVLQNNPRLVEAMYFCELPTPTEQLGSTYAVLGKKRARVLKEEMQEGTSLLTVLAYLPVAESIGFSNQPRSVTSGAASALLVISHWEAIPEDPFFTPKTQEEIEEFGDGSSIGPNLAKKLMNYVRRRKGLHVEEKVMEHGSKLDSAVGARLPLDIICFHLEKAASDRLSPVEELIGDEDVTRALLGACRSLLEPVFAVLRTRALPHRDNLYQILVSWTYLRASMLLREG